MEVMRTVISPVSVSFLALFLAHPLPAIVTERGWFSVDPAHWTADGSNWVSSVEGGAWTRPDGDASGLVAADGGQTAHIDLDTGDGKLLYKPDVPSAGSVVHTDATLFFRASPLLPDIPSGPPQGAITVWETSEGPTYVGLVNGEWVPLSNDAAPPVTDGYADVRVSLDYSGAAPSVSYAVNVGGTYVTLHDESGTTSFPTALPDVKKVTAVGFAGTGRIGTFSGAEIVNLEEYDLYINLDEDMAGIFLGTGLDYGGGSWEHVTAASPAEALRFAAEQKFGPGSITISDGQWGASLDTVNGMSGLGGSLSSLQDEWGYGDIFFYPVQWVRENGAWTVAGTSIMDYAGPSRTFALTFQATAFDAEATEHTFEDEGDAAAYALLRETYNWNGWSQPAGPNFAVTNVAVASPAPEIEVGGNATLVATVSPAEALNPNVRWGSDDTAVATVSEAGVVTGVAPGTATLTATTVDGGLVARCVVAVVTAADTLTDGGVTIGAGVGTITFTDIRPGEATVRFEGAITGEAGASGTFALRYTKTLGGDEFRTNVTVVLQEDGSALVEGVPMDLPSFFAIGFTEKVE